MARPGAERSPVRPVGHPQLGTALACQHVAMSSWKMGATARGHVVRGGPARRPDAPIALAPYQCQSLLDEFAKLADPRQRRGRRHGLSAVLAVAVAAVLAGARSLVAISEWAADPPQPVLAALGVRLDPLRRVWRPPGEATVRRVRSLHHHRWRAVTVYAVTSLPFAQAHPAHLADWIRGHWGIEICQADCAYGM
jgi:DDE_Tnp_1-associated